MSIWVTTRQVKTKMYKIGSHPTTSSGPLTITTHCHLFFFPLSPKVNQYSDFELWNLILFGFYALYTWTHFCSWLLSLNIRFDGFFIVVIYISSCVMSLLYSIHFMNTTWLIYRFYSRWTLFQFGNITNNAVLSTMHVWNFFGCVRN